MSFFRLVVLDFILIIRRKWFGWGLRDRLVGWIIPGRKKRKVKRTFSFFLFDEMSFKSCVKVKIMTEKNKTSFFSNSTAK